MKFGNYARPENQTSKRVMREENARLVNEYLANGGKITRVPSGAARF